VTFIHKTRHTNRHSTLGIHPEVSVHYRVVCDIKYDLLHTDRYAGYQRIVYKHVHVHHSTEGIRLMKLSFRRQGRTLLPVHERDPSSPIIAHHASRGRDSERPCRGGLRLCGVGVRGLARGARIFGYVSSRRRWSLASISSNLVPSGSGIVRQTVLSSTSRTIVPSSTSVSVTLTVLQLTSSRAGKGW